MKKINRLERREGFTLIELLVVVSIVGLLSSVVFAAVSTSREKGRIGAGKYFEAQVGHVSGDSLVANWNFDDGLSGGTCSGSVTTASDSSGYNNTGTLQGDAAWVSDTPSSGGCSVYFAAFAHSYVTVPNSSVLQLDDNFTVSMWVKPMVSSAQVFLLKGDNSLHGAALAYGYNSNGYMFIADNSNNTPAAPQTGTDIKKWNQLVGVVSGGVRTLYVNGILVGSSPQSVAGSWAKFGATPNNDPLIIGANAISNTAYTEGYIDNVRIYAKTLTASEVGKLYASEKGRYETLARE
jgi:prepilin-type N-terminal cleavage/methylation domain-containing protein